MTLREFITGELIDIIEWPDQTDTTMAWRFSRPQNEIKNGAQLIVRWNASTDDRAPQAFIRYDVSVNGELRAVVIGTTTAEVEVDYGFNDVAIVAVDTADNESAPGTIAVIH